MPWCSLEFWGSLISFSGGVVLTVDVLRQRKLLREERGGASLREIVAKFGRPDALEGSTRDLQDWLAARLQRHAWIGFGLMAAGFLLDIVGQWTQTAR